MSRLIDRLNQVMKGTSSPLGFQARRAASPKLKMLLIASVSKAESTRRRGEDTRGTDGIIINRPGADTGAGKETTGVPRGIRREGGGGRAKEAEAGVDFIVFPADGDFSAVGGSDTGRLLEVDSAISEGMIRAVNRLPVDAVLISGKEETETPLTWQQLMRYARFGELLRKPLLVSVRSEITGAELVALWKAGVVGVVMGGGVRQGRETIDQTQFPPRQPGEMGEPIPRLRGEASGEIDSEEREEEEEEGEEEELRIPENRFPF